MGFKKIFKDLVGKVETALGSSDKRQINEESLPELLDKSWSGRAKEGVRHYRPFDYTTGCIHSREGSAHVRRNEGSTGRDRESSIGNNYILALNSTSPAIAAHQGLEAAAGPPRRSPTSSQRPQSAAARSASARSANRSAPARDGSRRGSKNPSSAQPYHQNGGDSAMDGVQKVNIWLESNSSSDPSEMDGAKDSASSVHDDSKQSLQLVVDFGPSSSKQLELRTPQQTKPALKAAAAVGLERSRSLPASREPSNKGNNNGGERMSLLSWQIRNSNNPSAAPSREGSSRPVRMSASSIHGGGEYSGHKGGHYLPSLVAGIPEVDKLVQVILTEEASNNRGSDHKCKVQRTSTDATVPEKPTTTAPVDLGREPSYLDSQLLASAPTYHHNNLTTTGYSSGSGDRAVRDGRRHRGGVAGSAGDCINGLAAPAARFTSLSSTSKELSTFQQQVSQKTNKRLHKGQDPRNTPVNAEEVSAALEAVKLAQDHQQQQQDTLAALANAATTTSSAIIRGAGSAPSTSTHQLSGVMHQSPPARSAPRFGSSLRGAVAGAGQSQKAAPRSDWDRSFIKRWKAVKKRARLQALGLRSIWKVSSPEQYHMPELLTSELPHGDAGPLSNRAITVPGATTRNALDGDGEMHRDPSLATMLLGEVAEVC